MAQEFMTKIFTAVKSDVMTKVFIDFTGSLHTSKLNIPLGFFIPNAVFMLSLHEMNTGLVSSLFFLCLST
jgi:hypothetical protein